MRAAVKAAAVVVAAGMLAWSGMAAASPPSHSQSQKPHPTHPTHPHETSTPTPTSSPTLTGTPTPTGTPTGTETATPVPTVTRTETLNPRPDARTCTGSPITISAGGTYNGCYVSDDPAVAAVTVNTSQPVIIDGAGIRSKGHLIRMAIGANANLTVRDTTGVAVNPGVAGQSPGRFITGETGTVDVRHCRLIGTSGMYFLSLTSVVVLNNDGINIDGRHSTGAGYSTTARDLVQFVQTNQVTGHIEIGWNRITNVFGESAPEDVISLYRSHGSSGDKLNVHHNLVDGAYPMTTTGGFSGSAVAVDDATSWAWIHDNVAVATTNAGIFIAGGNDNLVENNRMVSAGKDPSGTYFTAANVGTYVWNFYSFAGWANNQAQNNVISWMKADGTRNDAWYPDCNPPGTCSDSDAYGGTITTAQEDAEVEAWETARAAAGQTIGPR